MKAKEPFNGRGNIPSPCGTCEKSGCGAYHDECEKFKAYQAEVKTQRETIKARKDLDYLAKHYGKKRRPHK